MKFDYKLRTNIASIFNFLIHIHTLFERICLYLGNTKIKGHHVCNLLSSKWSSDEQIIVYCIVCICVCAETDRETHTGREERREYKANGTKY